MSTDPGLLIVEFGPFSLDTQQRLLTRSGDVIPLEPKVIDTLVVLVEAEGRLVTKQDLMERVWPGTFVEEGSLARNVSALRRALGDTAEEPRYIETVPRRGYRFSAPVRRASARTVPTGPPSVDPAHPSAAAEDEPPPPDVRSASRRLWLYGAALATLLLAATAGAAVWGAWDREAGIRPVRSMARANEGLGHAFYWARRFKEAIPAFRRSLELDANIFGSRVLLAYALAFEGRAEESIALLDTPPLQRTTFMAFMKLRAGRREEGLRLLRELTAATPPIESNFMAVTRASFGDREQAISWLTRAVDTREVRAARVIDPGYDALRADPRFHELVNRLKMPASYHAFLRAKGVEPD